MAPQRLDWVSTEKVRVVALKSIGADTAGMEFGDGPLYPPPAAPFLSSGRGGCVGRARKCLIVYRPRRHLFFILQTVLFK